MTLSEVQQKKFLSLFDRYDQNNDGYIENSDFESLCEQLTTLRKLDEETDFYKKFTVSFKSVWQQLQKSVDVNDDKRVSRDEWLEYYTKVCENPRIWKIIEMRAKSIFELINVNDDGLITKDEFVNYMRIYGVSEDDANASFNKLLVDGKSNLDEDDVIERINDFYLSDKPDSPGNWMMGPWH